MKNTPLLFALSISLLSVAQQKDTVAMRYGSYISKEELKKHLHVLASDEYEGRETGKNGQKKAAEYISGQFRSFGIKPHKDGLYYQKFDIYPSNSSKTVITINGKDYQLLKDFYSYRGTSDKITVANEFVFAGYGISDTNYSDYTGLDVKNKIVIVLDGEPYKDSISLVSKTRNPSPWSDEERMKIKAARERGALALFVVTPFFAEDVKRAAFFIEHSPCKLEKPENIAMPVFALSDQMFMDMMAAAKTKRTLDEIREGISLTGKTYTIQSKASIKIDYRQEESILHTENVLGYVEGSDLKHELIVVSAHYDHLGVIDGKVYNGADDDGSGTVTVIELARIFMKAKQEGKGPRRSLLFIGFAGEEKGLLGSAHYVQKPEFPLSSTICDLNIDMIGRMDGKQTDSLNYVYVIGSGMLSTYLKKVSEQANALYCGMKLDYTYDDPKDKNRFYYRSDHYNFARNNIPVIFYFNGTHSDYHKDTDEISKIDFALMEKRAKLVFFTAWALANSEQKPELDVPQKK
jgi:hypothetical protein